MIYTAVREICATISFREREREREREGRVSYKAAKRAHGRPIGPLEKIKFKLCEIILMRSDFFEVL